MTRKLLLVAAFGALYSICAAVAALSAVGAAVSGFEPGTAPASAATVRVLGAFADGLMMPLVPLFHPRGLWTYPLIFGNGIIWGSVLIVLWNLVRRRRRESVRAA
jgi:hypothetical protein